MGDEKNITDLIKQLAQTGAELYAKVGKVEAVREEAVQIDVAPIDGTAMIYNVRLQADDAGFGLLRVPVVGSMVVVVFLSKHQAVLVNDSGLEKFRLLIKQTELVMDETKIEQKIENTSLLLDQDKLRATAGDHVFEMDAAGFLLQSQNETLKGLITDLLTAIEAMTFMVATPDTINGTTTAMTNLAQFTAIKTRFNQFLK